MNLSKSLLIFVVMLFSCKQEVSNESNFKSDKQKIIDSISYLASSKSLDNVGVAIEEYSKIIEMESDNLDALSNRAVLLKQNGEFERAIVDLSNVIRLSENRNELNSIGFNYLWRGECKYELGDYLGALRDFDKAEESNLDVDDLYVYRAYSFLKIGDLNNACKNFSIAGERGYVKAYDEINKYCN